jgi:hypothetical protein
MGILSSFRTQKPKKLKPRTQAIDPKLPRGKVGKGPLEPRDSTTRVFMDPMKRIKSNMAERPKRDNPAYSGNAIMALNKGPGLKKGGSVKKMQQTVDMFALVLLILEEKDRVLK